MDAAFASHIVFWVIGAMTLGSIIAVVGALFSMGRSSYRKD